MTKWTDNECRFLGSLCSNMDYTEASGDKKSRLKFSLAVWRGKANGVELGNDFLPFIAFGYNADEIYKNYKPKDRLYVISRANKPDKHEYNGKTIYPDVRFIVDHIVSANTVGSMREQKREYKKDWQAEQKQDDFMSMPEDISGELPFS